MFATAVIVLLIISILFTPIVLALDTRMSHCSLRWGKLVQGVVSWKEELEIYTKLLFFKFRINPNQFLEKDKKATPDKTKPVRKKKQFRINYGRLKRLMKLRYLILEIDGSSPDFNAVYYTIRPVINHPSIQIMPNYDFENHLRLELETTVAKALRLFI